MTPFSPARPQRAETRCSSSVVHSRVPPCDVPQGYASVVPLPAALLGCHFERPASEPDEERDISTYNFQLHAASVRLFGLSCLFG
jgi:hypothetical protein